MPGPCNGLARPTNVTETHLTDQPLATTSQPLSANISINNGDKDAQTGAPPSEHSPTEQTQRQHFPSFVQPVSLPINQGFGEPADQLVASLASCSILESHSDASAMINDNIALRYA
jgi:hypothetical protein